MRVAGAARMRPTTHSPIPVSAVTADRPRMTWPGSSREQPPGTPAQRDVSHQFRRPGSTEQYRPEKSSACPGRFLRAERRDGRFPAVITGRSRCLFRWVRKIPVTIRNRSPREWAVGGRICRIAHRIFEHDQRFSVIDHSRWSGNVPANGGCRPGEAAGRANRARIERITQRSRGSVGGPGTNSTLPLRGGRNQKVFDHGSSHRKAGAVTNPFPGRGGRCCRAS